MGVILLMGVLKGSFYRPEPYLFLSTRKDQPLSISSAQKLYSQAKRTACITKSGGIHSLRHAYATCVFC